MIKGKAKRRAVMRGGGNKGKIHVRTSLKRERLKVDENRSDSNFFGLVDSASTKQLLLWLVIVCANLSAGDWQVRLAVYQPTKRWIRHFLLGYRKLVCAFD